MQNKIRMGYGHMDNSRSIYPEYIKGTHQFTAFDPNGVCRTGTQQCMVDAFNGDKIPLSLDFDYRQLDFDLMYIWFQGGAYNDTLQTKILRKIKEESDVVVIINWEEIYQFTDAFVQHAFKGLTESAELADVVACAYLDFDQRMERVGVHVPNWRYLVTPYDTKWITYHYFRAEKEMPRQIYSML